MYEQNKRYTLTCKYCGKQFVSNTHNRTYCTDKKCKDKALTAKRERIRRTMRKLRNMRKWKKGL